MKVVEAFLFSEPYEDELLLLKLILSNGFIDEFIVCENAYSHQGDFKGHTAQKIIDGDDRFAPYRHKIKVIEGNKQFTVVDKSKAEDGIAFICENWQRGLAHDYFMDKYEDEDWIILHDVDEMMDFTNDKRRIEFFERLSLAKEGFLAIPRLRYWFDFDNQFEIMYVSSICTKKYISNQNGKTFTLIRNHITNLPLVGWKNIIAFEYSSCFNKDHIVRKIQTTAHSGNGVADLLVSLNCNHRTMRPEVIKKHLRPTKKFFFKTVSLNEGNSPLYVREHLNELKMNNVSPNYEENRRKAYPQFYNPVKLGILFFTDFFLEKKRWVEKKIATVKIKLGIHATASSPKK